MRRLERPRPFTALSRKEISGLSVRAYRVVTGHETILIHFGHPSLGITASLTEEVFSAFVSRAAPEGMISMLHCFFHSVHFAIIDCSTWNHPSPKMPLNLYSRRTTCWDSRCSETLAVLLLQELLLQTAATSAALGLSGTCGFDLDFFGVTCPMSDILSCQLIYRYKMFLRLLGTRRAVLRRSRFRVSCTVGRRLSRGRS